MQAEAASATSQALALPESHIVSALRNAAAVTGSDFHYLLGTAMRESSLNPDAACKLIRLAGSDPTTSAAAQFPQAASANKSVFFHADGAPKSVREVYDWALRQPGVEGTIRQAPTPAPDVLTAHTRVAGAQSAEVQMLLASVINWRPRHSLFGGLFG